MSRNDNNFHFDIPIPIIILAFFFNFPIGVVLTVLRAISIPNARNKVNEAAKKIEQKANEFEQRAENRQQTRDRQYVEKTRADYAAANAKGKKRKKRAPSAGVVISTIATIGCFALGVLVFLESMSSGFHGFGDFLQQMLFYVFPFMTAAGVSYLCSLGFKNRDARINRIRALIGEKDSFSLVKIAAASKDSLKKVRRDVQHMIDKGEFGEYAYIDLGTNNFMRHPDAAPDVVEGFDYRSVYDKNIFGKAEAEAARKTQTEESAEEEKPVSDKDNFRSIILEIRRLNDDIVDIAVSERIYRIEEHTQHIFDYVIEHPEAMPQIRTFMNYYLPTTLKLLESYSRIERVGVAGENMKKSKENIENILDMLVIGFEQQVDQLFKNESIDISSDISVLETMMQKDGLNGKSDFQLDLNAFSDELTELSDELTGGNAAAQKMPDDK